MSPRRHRTCGARRCWSTSRKATTPARLTRCRAASVPTTSRAPSSSPAAALAVISTASTPVSAVSSSAARVTPTRSDLRRFESHTAQTSGRVSPHRRHSSPPPASDWAMAPPHRVQRTRVPHRAQARRRIRPVRLRMHTTRPSGGSSVERRTWTSRSENRPVRGSSAVRSTTSTVGHPRRSRGRGVVTNLLPSVIVTGGQGDTSTIGASSRRARSTATSTADQVGDRSSRYASSWASSTTAARTRLTGAHAAARVPITTPSCLHARSHMSGMRATSTPDARRRAAACSARPWDGASTRTPAGPVRWTTSSTTSSASKAGARRTTEHRSPEPRASSTMATAPPPGDGGRRPSGAPSPPASAPVGPHLAPADHMVGGRGPEERGDRARPTPRRPLGQGHHGRRGSDPARTGEGFDHHLGRGPHVVLDHPTADPTPVEVDPDPAAHAHLRGQSRGHRIVETAVDSRNVGHHPDDARAGGRPARPDGRRRCSGTGVQSPSACFRSSARDVSSQVNSRSARPKCP